MDIQDQCLQLIQNNRLDEFSRFLDEGGLDGLAEANVEALLRAAVDIDCPDVLGLFNKEQERIK